MLYSLPERFAGGNFHFVFQRSPIRGYDDYFAVMDAVRPMLDQNDFKVCTIGFYINADTVFDNVITLRLNYFSVNVPETIRIVEQFVRQSSRLTVVKCEHPNVNTPCGEYNNGSILSELKFKNFLNAHTRIILEMMENFGKENTRNLVEQYRYKDLPREIRPEPVLHDAFIRHSPSYRQLVDSGLARTFWDDLVRIHHWNPPNDVGLHFMVNMLYIEEQPYSMETLMKLLTQP